jgi:hypothetical protein
LLNYSKITISKNGGDMFAINHAAASLAVKKEVSKSKNVLVADFSPVCRNFVGNF